MIFNLLDAAPAAKGAGFDPTMIIMLVALFAIMYFFMIRPQQKKQKEIQKFRNSLTVGSKIVTASGVYGVVKDLNEGESYLTIEIAKGITVQIDRNYVYADSTQQAQK